jgi:two-component system sensor histidine kinase/response regulator
MAASLQDLALLSPDPIIGVNRAGIINSFNAAAERLLGYTRDEVVERLPIARVYPSLNHARQIKRLLYASVERQVEGCETQLVSKSGRVIDVRLSARLIVRNGEEAGSIGFFHDLTERKRTEAELAQHRDHLEALISARTAELAAARDAAEAASRAKSAFLANMSHELHTPMNGIMGMTDLALRCATDTKQIDWLSKSKRSAQHLLVLIDNILDISRLEAGQLTLEENDFCLTQLIGDTLRLQDEVARAKGLSLSVKIDPGLPDPMRGDAMRLRQILSNIVGNAIKFSERGEITVHVHASEEDGVGLLLRIEVADQGIGISPAEQARLFQTFTQVDGSFTRKYGGTGLGLIISKRLALLLGGQVGADSTPGVGSTFWFTVRLQRGRGYLPRHQTPDRGRAINACVAPDSATDFPGEVAADPLRAQAVLKQLEPLLATGDTSVGALFRAHRSLILGTHGAEAKRLGLQIEDFDYPGALETLRVIVRHAQES